MQWCFLVWTAVILAVGPAQAASCKAMFAVAAFGWSNAEDEVPCQRPTHGSASRSGCMSGPTCFASFVVAHGNVDFGSQWFGEVAIESPASHEECDLVPLLRPPICAEPV